jgi:cytochrome oxidase assembly protein ShyY1
MIFSLAKKVKNGLLEQWQLTLLVVLFLPLLFRLGFWQLERAEEKQQLLSVYQQQRKLPARKVEFVETSAELSDYQSLIISGQYDSEHYWLLDNKPRGGKVGYEVVMPLWTGQQWILVNRGWVAAPRLREQLPTIETPVEFIMIQGYFYSSSKNALLTHSESDLAQAWPKRVLKIDISSVEKALNKQVFPTILRIEADNPSALITDWPVINTLPEKHQAYAVQWFAMAIALIFLYVWALMKKHS